MRRKLKLIDMVYVCSLQFFLKHMIDMHDMRLLRFYILEWIYHV